MSDARPRRAARDSGRSEPVAAEEPAASDAAADAPPLVAANLTAETVTAAAVAVSPPEPAAPVIRGPEAAGDAWTALTEAQAAVARACEEIAVELGGITRSGIAAGSDAALALLGARTLAEAVEINAVLVRRGFDAIVEGSARLSEIGVKAVAEASQPLLTRLSATWSAAGIG
jgi:hypothetical protein